MFRYPRLQILASSSLQLQLVYRESLSKPLADLITHREVWSSLRSLSTFKRSNQQ